MRRVRLRKVILCLWVLTLCALFWITEASALPLSYQKLGVPDFSQLADPAWGNSYCAPTAAANSVWYFGEHGFPLLNQGFAWGDNAGAGTVISDLGTDMNTDPWGGTSATNIRDGWQTYLDRYYPTPTIPYFQTELVWASDFANGGTGLWEYMKEELYRCEDVMPLVLWDGGGGHAITMVGWDSSNIYINDPWNNPGNQHNWGGEYLGVTTTVTSGGIGVSWGTGTGTIAGAVVSSPVIPEPTTIILMGCGLIGLLSIVIRQRRKEK
ncbi:PEP-CTERM sorting domain-containing protein [bacterium]|nr:PEP-CTERM sorting domain-containing protein [bacterium]